MSEYSGYPPNQPRKGMSTGAKIGAGCGGCAGLVVILVMVVVIAGVLGGDSDDTGNGGSDTEAGGNDEGQDDSEEAAGIGDTVESGAFAFTVTDLETGVESVGDNQYLTETPDGQYVIAHITVENVGDQAGTFDSTSQKLVDADGKEYSTDSSAQVAVDTDSWINEINPGNSVDGQLIFDVPAETELATLELSDFLTLEEPAVVELAE
ncbi:hypothetical protein F4561_006030 [Lipingzhangella halophila]|uniref:DUF4352 domain-containing protein n=1 Tax=Lipingzhangella halophila TaxID=1783352 RepID=A0A7W7RNC3_9ACTN|nr:DUF4352 domain-containing protein [Lipingzhangella halophila]MBB4935136.1 hypothetical protein [Lipingzhangella halophila]